MWKKYFSKYKWTDLFWILFVILTCLLAGNSNLYPLTHQEISYHCLLYTSPSPRDGATSRMPSSA